MKKFYLFRESFDFDTFVELVEMKIRVERGKAIA